MFPDPTLRWHPFPSRLDGIDRPPFVLGRGLWQGVLSLILVEAPPRKRAFGVQIKCEAYLTVEEMIYSVADHGGGTAAYDGTVYLKEASQSRVRDAYKITDPLHRGVRHFLLVGSDFCYETIGFDDPVVRRFASVEAAYEWRPDTEVGPPA
jgi:hypothetical protein